MAFPRLSTLVGNEHPDRIGGAGIHLEPEQDQDQRPDLLHIAFNFRREAGHVERVEARRIGGENLPRGLLQQSHFKALFISISEAGCAAEQVGDVDQRSQHRIPGGISNIVMVAHHLRKIVAEVPVAGEQVSGDLVGHADLFALHIEQRPPRIDSDLEDPGELVGNQQYIDEDPEVVHQAREIGALEIGVVDFAREVAADQRAGQRVLPEACGIEVAAYRLDLHKAAGGDDLAQPRNAQGKGRGPQAGDPLTRTEGRRIRDMKDLAAEHAVVRDELDCLIKVNIVAVRAELVERGKKDRRQRRQLVEALDPALKFG